MSEIALPTGYILASWVEYPGGLNPLNGRQMGYNWAVQLLNQQTADMPRGTGQTRDDAIRAAIAHAGGDDGLSAAFRAALKGEAG